MRFVEGKIQSGPENPSGNLVLPYGKTKIFVGTDLVAHFQFGGVRFPKTVV